MDETCPQQESSHRENQPKAILDKAAFYSSYFAGMCTDWNVPFYKLLGFYHLFCSCRGSDPVYQYYSV